MNFKQEQQTIEKVCSIYGDLPRLKNEDLPDFAIQITSKVLEQYIMEDGLKKGDDTLTELMNVAESFLLKIIDVIVFSQRVNNNQEWHNWLNSLHSGLSQHATYYQLLYQPISHLLTGEYRCTSYALCYLIESVLEITKSKLGSDFEKHFNKLKTIEQDNIHYLVRFGENLIIELYDGVKQTQ